MAVEFMPLDLSSLQSTREFTAAFRERNLPLHILINNAGVAWLQQRSESTWLPPLECVAVQHGVAAVPVNSSTVFFSY